MIWNGKPLSECTPQELKEALGALRSDPDAYPMVDPQEVEAVVQARAGAQACTRCQGSGVHPQDPGRPCVKCGGTGWAGAV